MNLHSALNWDNSLEFKRKGAQALKSLIKGLTMILLLLHKLNSVENQLQLISIFEP